MDYIKEAENYLYHYRDMKRAVRHAVREIKRIRTRTAPGAINAVLIDVTGVRASKEANTLDDMYKLQEWINIFRENQKEVEHISKALHEISQEEKEPYKELLEYWYIERKSCAEICENMEIKKSEFYEKKREALQKLAISLFGIRMIKVI